MLDYSLATQDERLSCLEDTIQSTNSSQLTPVYLSSMADYILFVADRDQTKKERTAENPIITKNREATVNKRQVSYEELITTLENGEDGLYTLIANDKNQILDPKQSITSADKEEIPGLQDQLDLIASLQQQFQHAEGKMRYSLKKQIIETWQQIYILKSSYRGVPARGKTSNQVKSIAHADLSENITIDPDTLLPVSDGLISLLNPAHIGFLLCHYSQLKQECSEDLLSDMFTLLLDLENLVEKTLRDSPVLYALLIWKIDGLSNKEIQAKMRQTFNAVHSEQYFSSLWRKRIPKLLAEQAQKDYLIWYYTNKEYGNWKYCTGCGEYKLANPLFFARNTSKDGYYSRCKDCKTASVKTTKR